MWWWAAAVAAAVAIIAAVLWEFKGDKAEGAGLPAIAGVLLGMIACSLASSYDLESYSLSVFGAHISLLALGVMALTAAAFSKSSDGLPMAVSGVVTVVMVLLTYAGYIGIYIGTLALVGTACLALVLMDLGVISGSGNLWRDVRLAVSVAAGTALLWLGVSGIALGLVDYLNLLDAVSGATFSAACALACVLAFRSGKHAKVATAATALTVLAGSVCVISLLFIRGLMY